MRVALYELVVVLINILAVYTQSVIDVAPTGPQILPLPPAAAPAFGFAPPRAEPSGRISARSIR